jgi:XisI protein
MVRKIKKYQQLLEKFLQTELPENQSDEIGYQVITDMKNNHFQLIEMGWYETKFIYRVAIHLSIKPSGKVWLWVNNTDTLVAEELVKLGILASDIVLGFHSVGVRQYTGFAVA